MRFLQLTVGPYSLGRYLRFAAGIKLKSGTEKYVYKPWHLLGLKWDVFRRMIENKLKILNLLGQRKIQSVDFLMNLHTAYNY